MSIARLRTFVQNMTRAMDANEGERAILAAARPLLSDLITHDDWLPDAFAMPNPSRYQQYLLYCDPLERFSVVSFVWGPGQKTPVHDHKTWGMVGVMRGAELCREYTFRAGVLEQTGEHHAPGLVIVDRGFLPRTPDETDHRKSLKRVAIQEVLLIARRIRHREGVRQPVIVGDEIG